MSVKSKHSMPFGAEPTNSGEVRFRLWAPACERVELCIEGPGTDLSLPMEPTDDGWFEAISADAGPGTLYRYRVDGQMRVPDPAARHQPKDVHGPSQVVDPEAWEWKDDYWRGRPWDEAVVYELHVGAFSPSGDFAGVAERLDYLAGLGVTAVELMPLSDFPGARNWGYDGVLPFAPDSRYGRPDDLKRLIETAHAKGLMVLLDVVYNHFGPEGNYLHVYAPQFFTERHHTPWGAAINFDGEESRWVRQFFIHNALYWLEEYHFDGLRLDAVHAIADDSTPDILEELADAVHQGPGCDKHIHLVLENDNNAAHYLRPSAERPGHYVAQWNDDIHHALHVLTTREKGGYYQDYRRSPASYLGRCLSEGFAYQGEPSPYRHGEARGEPTRGLPPTAFLSFLQNHDQIGNRAFGDRLTSLAPEEAVKAATALLLLAPSPPLLFMGQEWASHTPFLFFCNFGADLADAVTQGRRREFARFPEFSDPKVRDRIPDPSSLDTFRQSCLNWEQLEQPRARSWLDFHGELLRLRRQAILPLVRGAVARTEFSVFGPTALKVTWHFAAAMLVVLANLSDEAVHTTDEAEGNILYAYPKDAEHFRNTLAAWSTIWRLRETDT